MAKPSSANKLNKEQRSQLLVWLAAGYSNFLIQQWMAEQSWPVISSTAITGYRKRNALQLRKIEALDANRALNSGLALKAERVRRLTLHADQLESIMWVPDKDGKFPNEKAWRETLDDIAAEMGHRSKTLVIKTWQDTVVEKLKAGEIAPEVLRQDIQDDAVANDLLARAGLPLLEAPQANSVPANTQVVEGHRTVTKEEALGWYSRMGKAEPPKAAVQATTPPAQEAPEPEPKQGSGLESLYTDSDPYDQYQ